MPRNLSTYTMPHCQANTDKVSRVHDLAAKAWAEHLDACEARYDLFLRLKQTVAGLISTDTLEKVMPELAHLIPKPDSSRLLPSVIGASNLVAELVKAGMVFEEKA